MTERRVVVVDGSNLATEGRTTPSLQQLDEAVRAYAEEDPEAEIVVVVDASFEHRVDPAERAALEEAELHGEVVSPPAGAIGRGDAFVLRIAERSGASVLSNDSFQEFHAEHPWLFDEGRLIGGKPVPGIGWIFTPRIPVRGPKSRQATARARRAGAAAGTAELSAPDKAAELAKAARKAAAARMAVLPDGTAPKVGDVWQAPATPAAAAEGAAGEGEGAPGPAEAAPPTKRKRAAKAATAEETVEPTATRKKAAAKVAAPGKKAAAGKKAAPGKKAAGKKGPAAATVAAKEAAAATAAATAAVSETQVAAAAGKKARGKKAAAKKAAPEAAATEAAAPEAAAAEPGVVTEPAAAPAPAVAKVAKAAKAPRTGKRAAAAKKAVAKEPAEPAAEMPAGGAPAGAGVEAGAETGAEAETRAAPAKRRGGRAKKAAATAPAAPTTPPVPAEVAGAAPEHPDRAAASRSRAREDPALRDAIDEATAEALSPRAEEEAPEQAAVELPSGTNGRAGEPKDGKAGRRRRRRPVTPPPAVNEPLAFITFVATFPLGSELEGEVVSFTSHGAMVDVPLPGGETLHCYIPLTSMGEPPPTKARQVLSRSERRPFVLTGLDPSRRVAELALPGVVVAAAADTTT